MFSNKRKFDIPMIDHDDIFIKRNRMLNTSQFMSQEKTYTETEVQKMLQIERAQTREYYMGLLRDKIGEFQQILNEMHQNEIEKHLGLYESFDKCNYIS